MTNNQVILSGKIESAFEFSHEFYGEGFYRAFLSVKRTSGVIDIIPLIVSDRIIDVSLDYTNENVHILGQFRTYNKCEDNKCHLVINVFVTEFALDNDPYERNEIYLEGYICKEPTYRETPLGRQISDFILAVNRNYGKSDYIPCISWGRTAGYISKLAVGTCVRIKGRIQSREYVKDSTTKTAYEISVISIENS